MSDITISYKNETIATRNSSGTITLETEGKYCEDDIVIVYTQPSGGGGGGISIVESSDSHGGTIMEITGMVVSGSTTITDNGTYSVASYESVTVAIPNASGVNF